MTKRHRDTWHQRRLFAGQPLLIYCSCGKMWRGGDPKISEHLRDHRDHVWWSERSYPPPDVEPPE